MAMEQLEAPLRLTWDLHGAAGVAAADPSVVADALIEAGVFYVLLDRRPLAHAGITALLERLRHGAIRPSATFAASDAEWANIAVARTVDPLFVDLNAVAPDGAPAPVAATVVRLRDAGVEPALLMTPTRANLPFLARTLELAATLGIKRFKLPNSRVDASFTSADRERLPTSDDLCELRSQLGGRGPVLRETLQLEIHDLFIWEIFYPGERECGRAEYGGCQAGNSLGHVAADGSVYPCSSWPLYLGSLPAESLAEIWAKPEVARLRSAIAKVPSGCQGCRDYDLCLGGCRGLSATLQPHGDGRDLCCAARR